MGRRISIGPCPYCNKGHNTPCFAEYVDGYHCYSCGAHKKVSENTYAFKKVTISNDITYPRVMYDISKFSITTLQWLYNYHVYEQLIRKYKIAYSKELEESLVFNVIKEDKIIFWQQRFFPSKKFKTGGTKDDLFFIRNENSNQLILVEDYISAIRVGEIANVICLFGTHMNYNVSKFIKTIDISHIKLWLDNDDAGKKATNYIKSLLQKQLNYVNINRAFCVREQKNVTEIFTEKQPKQYTDSEIKTILGI